MLNDAEVMIVPFFSVPPAHRVAWVNVYAQQRSARRSRRNSPDDANRREFSVTAANSEGAFISEDALWSVLLEAMPLGVLVLASSLSMVYCNEKAKVLCDRLRNETDELPLSICQLCQRLIQKESSEPLIMEYQEQACSFACRLVG